MNLISLTVFHRPPPSPCLRFYRPLPCASSSTWCRSNSPRSHGSLCCCCDGISAPLEPPPSSPSSSCPPRGRRTLQSHSCCSPLQDLTRAPASEIDAALRRITDLSNNFNRGRCRVNGCYYTVKPKPKDL